MRGRQFPNEAPVITFLLSLAVLASSPPPLDNAGAMPIDLAQARRAFEEARAGSDLDAGRLWGVRLYGPMIFVDPQSRFVVANEGDVEGRLAPRDGLFVGTLSPEEPIANTAVTWAGKKWTMVMWPLPENRYARTRLLLHESFHRVQEALHLPGANPANNHLDTPEGRAWLRLEWRALAEALIRRGEERRRAAEDALVFRAYRRSFAPRAAEEERALELNEGLAEYTGLKLSGRPDWVLADRAAARLEQEDGGSGFVRSFAYASGPAYGILLDEEGARWRSALGTRSDFGDLLASALDLPLPESLAAEANRRAAAYDGQAVIEAEADRAALRRQLASQFRARFIDGPVLVLPLSQAVHYSYNPDGVEAFGETATIYPTATVSDRWGVLEVSGGVLMSRDASGSMAEARVPAPSDPAPRTLEGDDWTLSLNDGWRVLPGPRAGDFTLGPAE